MTQKTLKNSISLAETAQYLNSTLDEINNLIISGQICSYQDRNGQLLIDADCVKTLKTANHHKTKSSVIDSLTADDFIGIPDHNDYLTGQGVCQDNQNQASPENITDSELVSDNTELTLWNRENITNQNLTRLIGNMEFTNEKLHNAMYKIGYLEANITNLKAQLEATLSIPLIDNRTIELIKENDLLKAEKEKLSGYKATTEPKLAELEAKFNKLQSSWLWPLIKNLK